MLKLFKAILPAACTLLLAAQLHAPAQTLYDASFGTLPTAQGWYFSASGSPSQTVSNGSWILDTTSSISIQAGCTPLSAPVLNRTPGFTLFFTLQLLTEAHASADRAGLSLIVLGSDKKGLELAFWTNAVWAQSDSPIFTHAETANFNSTSTAADFALSIGPTNYALFANGVQILTGPVRDYTAFPGFPNPYRTPNFIFIGDNTTSAQAAFALKRCVLVTNLASPTLTPRPVGAIAWTGPSNLAYTVEMSAALDQPWQRAASVTSASDHYAYTNTAPQPARFLRVRFP